jgi:hypothetical protein
VRRSRIEHELGAVPAYATTATGAPEDIDPGQKRRRTRRGSLVAPEEPGARVSREEFQELVADLDVDAEPAAGARAARRSTTAEVPPPERDPAADLAPEDLVLKEEAKREKRRRPRNRRHGRSR